MQVNPRFNVFINLTNSSAAIIDLASLAEKDGIMTKILSLNET